MPSNGNNENGLAAADALLASRGIPPAAKEFRLRQEFFRIGWDMRVRDTGAGWTVRAVKANRSEVDVSADSESAALRLGLAAAIAFDEQ